MTDLFRIRDLDLADPEGLPAFIKFCQRNGVAFRIDQVYGPNGYPTCALISGYRPAIVKVLAEYCGGDEKAVADLDDMIEVV